MKRLLVVFVAAGVVLTASCGTTTQTPRGLPTDQQVLAPKQEARLALPTEWEVHPEAVLTPGEAGAFDDGDIQMGDVVKAEDHFLMVYSARRSDAPGHGANTLGIATSTDGVNWSKYEANPVLGPECRGPCLLHDPDDESAPYKLWYGHWQEDGGAVEIRCATSKDGLHWENAGTAITRGQPGSYDERQVAHASIAKAEGTYFLYYDAYANEGTVPPPERCIAVATSTDAMTWTKVGPALKPAGGNAWDRAVGDPAVVHVGGQFLMWYKGMAPSGDDPIRERIGLATSTDGLSFTRHPDNPILSPSADPQAFPYAKMFGPAVVWNGSAFHMWFGGPHADKKAFGYAVSRPVP